MYATLSGKITFPAGVDPTLGVTRVFLYASPVDSSFVDTARYAAFAVVAPDGAYTIPGLDAGSYLLKVDTTVAGVRSQWWKGAAVVELAAAIRIGAGQAKTGVNLTLAAPGAISGSTAVLPRQWLDVSVYTATGQTKVAAATAAVDGTFTLSDLAPGTYKVRFFSAGRGKNGRIDTWYGGKDYASATSITVRAGKTTAGILGPGGRAATIAGTVRHADGSAAGPESVSVRAIADAAPDIVIEGAVSTDGTYVVSGLPAGTYHVCFTPTSDTETRECWNDKHGNESAYPEGNTVSVASGVTRTGVDAQLDRSVTIAGTVTPLGAVASVRVFRTSDGQPVSTVQTDTDGRYRITGLPAGGYKIEFSAPNRVTQWWTRRSDQESATVLLLSAGEVAPAVNATLAPVKGTSSLSGKVAFPSGTDLRAGWTRVAIQGDGGTHYWASVAVGANGAYSFDGVPAGTYTLQVMSESRAVFDVERAVSVGRGVILSGVDVTLQKSAAVSGRITFPVDLASDRRWTTASVISAVDGTTVMSVPIAADGSYVVGGLASGTYRVRFSAFDYATLTAETWSADASGSPTSLTLSAGKVRTGVNLDLASRASISGRVSLPTGAEVTAELFTENGGYVASTRVSADGSYSIVGLRPGTYRVEFVGAGVGTIWWPNALLQDRGTPITLAGGERRNGVDATLDVGASIRGEVLVPSMADGFVSVCLIPADQHYCFKQMDLTGASDYAFADLAPGQYKISATNHRGLYGGWWGDANDFDSARVITVGPGDHLTGLDIVTKASGAISGKITVPASVDLSTGYLNVSATSAENPTMSWSGSVSADGTYTISHLPAGTYTVGFTASDSLGLRDQWWKNADSAASATPVTLFNGRAVTGIDATLAYDGASISGAITLPSGVEQWQGSTNVEAYDAVTGAWRGSAQTGWSDGRFTIAGLPAGSYALRVSSSGRDVADQWYGGSDRQSATVITLAEGERKGGIVVALVAGATISGKVSLPTGVTLPANSAVSVSAYDASSGYAGSSAAFATVASDGTYSLTRLKPGAYKLQFSPPWGTNVLSQWYRSKDGFSTANTVTVAAGQKRTGVDVTLAASASLSGTVTFPAGVDSSVGYTQVYVRSSAGSYVSSASVSRDGAYSIGGLTPGTYKLEFASSGRDVLNEWYNDATDAASATPIILAAGQSKTGVNVTLARGAKISGYVARTEGGALASASVLLYQKSGGSWTWRDSTTTDARGAYTFSSLVAGDYTLRFVAPSGQGLLGEWWNDKATMASATTITLAASQSVTSRNARLAAAATVTGTVAYADKSPLANVPVIAYDRVGNVLATASTDASGAYSLSDLAGGPVAIAASAPGGTVYSGGATSLAKAAFTTVTAGKRTTIAITVAGVTVKGKVTIAGSSTPLASGTVTLLRATGTPGVSVAIGADGSYTVRGVSAGSYVARVTPTSTAYTPTWSSGAGTEADADYFAVASSTVTKNLTVLAAGTVTGSLVGGGYVSLYRWSPSRVDYVKGTYLSSGGAFTFDGLAPGEYTVQVGAYFLGGARDSSAARHVTVTTGARTDLGSVDTTPRSGGTVLGSVTAPGASYASVYAFDAAGKSYYASTSGLSYSIVGLPAGSYRIAAQVEGYPTAWFGGKTATSVAVTNGSTKTANITATAGNASLSGKVTASAGGAAVPGAYLNLEEVVAGQNTLRVTGVSASAGGSYTFGSVLQSGRTYRLSASASGLSEASITFTATTGAVSKNFGLKAVGGLTGTVTDRLTGQTIPNLTVRAVADGAEAGEYTTVTDAAGGYDFTALRAGTYRVQFGAYSSGYTLPTTISGYGVPAAASYYAPEWLDNSATKEGAAAVVVAAGAKTKAKAGKVGQGGVVTGRISGTLASGSTGWLVDATVTVYTTADQLVAETVTGGSAPGTYALSVRPGTYKVCATAPVPSAATAPPPTCRAGTITVATGVVREGIDVRVSPTRASAAPSPSASGPARKETAYRRFAPM